MTTAAQVQAQWATVFAHASLAAISAKAHGYAITDASEAELKNLYSGKQVNFFQYLCTRQEKQEMCGQEEHYFNVAVEYTREKDPAGANWQAVRTAFETLRSTMNTVIGATWTGTVDFWRLEEPLADQLESVTIDDTDCWRGRVLYRGYKRESV